MNNKQLGGFFLQIFTNAAVRLLFMFLTATLVATDPEISTPYSLVLGYSTQLVPFLNLNLYQFVISRNPNDQSETMQSCILQYLFLFKINIVLILLLIGFYNFCPLSPILLLSLVSSIALSINEVVFAIATLTNKAWRALFNYGNQLLFFLIVLICIFFKKDVVSAYFMASLSLLTISHIVYSRLVKCHKKKIITVKDKVSAEYKIRIKSLLVSSPALLAIPISIFFLGRTQPEKTASLLLFVSISGAALFFLGNLYQYYGRHFIGKANQIVNEGNYKIICSFFLIIILSGVTLSLIIKLITTMVNINVETLIGEHWHFSAGILAAGMSINQWFSVICLNKNMLGNLFFSNAAYLCTVILLYLLHIEGGEFLEIQDIASVIRMLFQGEFYIFLAIASVTRMLFQLVLLFNMKSEISS